MVIGLLALKPGPKKERSLPSIIFFRGELLNFMGVQRQQKSQDDESCAYMLRIMREDDTFFGKESALSWKGPISTSMRKNHFGARIWPLLKQLTGYQ